MLSNFGDCVQYKEIVKSSLEELISGSKEVQEQAEKILDTENLFEAQQLLLHHQTAGVSVLLSRSESNIYTHLLSSKRQRGFRQRREMCSRI